MKKIIAGIAVAVVMASAAFFFFKGKDGEVRFRTEKAVKGDIVSTVTSSGTVNAVTTVLVGTQVSGTIKHLYVDFNSRVKKGQVIAQIDPTTLEAQADQSRANLLAAEANVEKAEASLADAQRAASRNKELFAKNYIAKSDLDTSESNYEIAKAQLSAAKAQVAQTKAALRYSNTNLEYTRILSPVDGIVVSRNVDVGQTVAASFQTPTLFNIAQDLTKMQIDSNVAEADIGKVQVGQNVEFTVDAYPDLIFKGKVSEIRNAPITVQNVVTYDVVIKVDNSELKLKPGMTANVSIIITTAKDVIKIPNAALRFKMQDKKSGGPKEARKEKGPQDKGRGLWVLENNTPKMLKVVTGTSDGNFTEVVSGDLKEGQEVILEALSKNTSKPATPPRMF
ncbi:MAG: efflux RND transporter periplasmic adaptor subunit [Nitrospirae bacterium]|nr:MAG: efflux RND transporter periplasmic adaptor subunit [Nitrospirota bacterium]